MPRMNDARRAELLKARLEEYRAVGLENHRNALFATSMVNRAARGKGFTAGQRSWVMNILEQPLPSAKDPERYEAILAAAAVEGLKHSTKNILKDFAIKVFNGWSLSEKQEAFLERLLAEAASTAEHGPWRPSEDEMEKIRLCLELSRRYDDNFYYSHGGLAKAVSKARAFMSDADSKVEFDEWCMNRLFKQFKTPLNELANPKHPTGEMRWAPVRTHFAVGHWNRGYKTTWHFSMVVDAPVVDDKGQVAYPMIVDGSFMNVASSNIKKRQPK